MCQNNNGRKEGCLLKADAKGWTIGSILTQLTKNTVSTREDGNLGSILIPFYCNLTTILNLNMEYGMIQKIW
jgi:hypothetical protein